MGKEAKINAEKRARSQEELDTWFKKERGLIVYLKDGGDETFTPTEHSWPVAADVADGNVLVVSVILDLGAGQTGKVPIAIYGEEVWESVVFDTPPQIVPSRLIVPDVGGLNIVPKE